MDFFGYFVEEVPSKSQSSKNKFPKNYLKNVA